MKKSGKFLAKILALATVLSLAFGAVPAAAAETAGTIGKADDSKSISGIVLSAGDTNTTIGVSKPAQVRNVKIKYQSFEYEGSTLRVTYDYSWNKVSKANGYQVQISTSQKFNKNTIAYNKHQTGNKVSIYAQGSYIGKALYVRIRAYKKTSGGGTVYGKWSKTRKYTHSVRAAG